MWCVLNMYRLLKWNGWVKTVNRTYTTITNYLWTQIPEHLWYSKLDLILLVLLVLHPVLWVGIDFEVFSIQWNILMPEACFFDWDNTEPKWVKAPRHCVFEILSNIVTATCGKSQKLHVLVKSLFFENGKNSIVYSYSEQNLIALFAAWFVWSCST